MTPEALATFLSHIVDHSIHHAVMIWGPPGVGKSSIVAAVAADGGLGMVDVRLSQLAPTDLRGLPVPAEGTSRWFPPEFLPRDGKGILFLDELNMAAPTMQGVAQQLILDRRVGSYTLPEGWFVWAAGNRKEDRASVFEMPAPLANRFIHIDVESDLDSFRRWAMTSPRSGDASASANAADGAASTRVDDRILAFLAFRPQLLHALDPKRPAWPSPRSWEMASSLLRAGLSIAPAVGEAAASEFDGFCSVYAMLPELEAILGNGTRAELDWPDEPSARYALTLGLANRADSAERAKNGFAWLAQRTTPEWVQLYTTDVAWRLRGAGQLGALVALSKDEPEFRAFLDDYAHLTGHGPSSSGAPASGS